MSSTVLRCFENLLKSLKELMDIHENLRCLAEKSGKENNMLLFSCSKRLQIKAPNLVSSFAWSLSRGDTFRFIRNALGIRSFVRRMFREKTVEDPIPSKWSMNFLHLGHSSALRDAQVHVTCISAYLLFCLRVLFSLCIGRSMQLWCREEGQSEHLSILSYHHILHFLAHLPGQVIVARKAVESRAF